MGFGGRMKGARIAFRAARGMCWTNVNGRGSLLVTNPQGRLVMD
jgi:hypothetical protein